MIVAKIGFLFVGVLFSCVNACRAVNKSDLPAMNMLLQAVGISGFITLQWLL